MSNLIPEKRVNKNGVSVTKHVKATSGTSVLVSPVPAPSLGSKPLTKMKLTPGQTSQVQRQFSVNTYFVDQRLQDALGPETFYKRRLFEISDKDMFSVLAVTDTGTAITLMNLGYKTADSVTQYLSEHGMDDLIEDHTEFNNKMLERRVTPEAYLEAVDFYPYLGETDRDADAIEAYSYASIRGSLIYNDVYHGEVNMTDVRTVGITRIAKSKDQHSVRRALKKVASGEVEYTADDVKTLIDNCPRSYLMHSAFEMAERFGMEFALSLKSTDHIARADYIEGTGADRERVLNFIRYEDEVGEYQRNNEVYALPISHEHSVKYFDAKISVADAGENVYTMQQLDAIMNGVEKSVSGGWL